MICFIDEVRERFGVEPVCRVLSGHGVRIAPRTYYAAKVRPPSTRPCGTLPCWRRPSGSIRIRRSVVARMAFGSCSGSCTAKAASTAARSPAGKSNG